MAVHDPVYVGELLVYFAVDVALREMLPLLLILLHRLAIVNLVLDEIVRRGQQCRGSILRQPERRSWIVWIADRDVTVGVKDRMIMQDVVSRES